MLKNIGKLFQINKVNIFILSQIVVVTMFQNCTNWSGKVNVESSPKVAESSAQTPNNSNNELPHGCQDGDNINQICGNDPSNYQFFKCKSGEFVNQKPFLVCDGTTVNKPPKIESVKLTSANECGKVQFDIVVSDDQTPVENLKIYLDGVQVTKHEIITTSLVNYAIKPNSIKVVDASGLEDVYKESLSAEVNICQPQILVTNSPPQITSVNLDSNQCEKVQLSVQAKDDDGDALSLWVKGINYGSDKTVQFQVQEGDFKLSEGDIRVVDSKGASTNYNLPLSVKVLKCDVTPPNIVAINVTSSSNNCNKFNLSVEVKDDSEIKSVKLYLNKTKDSDIQSEYDITKTKFIELTAEDNGHNNSSDTIIKYELWGSLVAEDAFGNKVAQKLSTLKLGSNNNNVIDVVRCNKCNNIAEQFLPCGKGFVNASESKRRSYCDRSDEENHEDTSLCIADKCYNKQKPGDKSCPAGYTGNITFSEKCDSTTGEYVEISNCHKSCTSAEFGKSIVHNSVEEFIRTRKENRICDFGELGTENIFADNVKLSCADGLLTEEVSKSETPKEVGDCPSYHWSQVIDQSGHLQWSECSASCGGVQSALFQCLDSKNNRVDDIRCGKKPTEVVQACDGNPDVKTLVKKDEEMEFLSSTMDCSGTYKVDKNNDGIGDEAEDSAFTKSLYTLGSPGFSYRKKTSEKYEICNTEKHELVVVENFQYGKESCVSIEPNRCSGEESLSPMRALGRLEWMKKCENKIPSIHAFFEATKDISMSPIKIVYDGVNGYKDKLKSLLRFKNVNPRDLASLQSGVQVIQTPLASELFIQKINSLYNLTSTKSNKKLSTLIEELETLIKNDGLRIKVTTDNVILNELNDILLSEKLKALIGDVSKIFSDNQKNIIKELNLKTEEYNNYKKIISSFPNISFTITGTLDYALFKYLDDDSEEAITWHAPKPSISQDAQRWSLALNSPDNQHEYNISRFRTGAEVDKESCELSNKINPKKLYIATLCRSSCTTPDSQILVDILNKEKTSYIDAFMNKTAFVTTFSNNTTSNDFKFQSTPVRRYIADFEDTVQVVRHFIMSSGKEVKFTQNHMLLAEDGSMKKAQYFNPGDSLVNQEGKLDLIADILDTSYNGKTYNLYTLSDNYKENIVITEGYLNGTAWYQDLNQERMGQVLLRTNLVGDALINQ